MQSVKKRSSRASESGQLSKKVAADVVLAFIFFIALWRSTGMWYGYSARFDDTDKADNTFALQLLLYSLIPLIGIYAWLEPKRIIHTIKQVPLTVYIFLAICACTIFVSLNASVSFRNIAAVSLLTVSPLLYRLRHGNAKTINALMMFAFFTMVANLLYTFTFRQFAIMGGEYAGMVKGLFYHKNGLGQFSALCLVMFFWVPSKFNLNFKFKYFALMRLLGIAIAAYLIVVSKSSTGVIMAVSGVFIIIFMRIILNRISQFKYRVGAILFGCALIAVVGSTGYLVLAEYIAKGLGKDMTFSGRSEIWSQLLPLVYDRPFLGHGFGVFRQPEIIGKYLNLTWHAKSTHNTYLELCLNIGIPGTLLLIFMIFSRLFSRILAYTRNHLLEENQAREIALILIILIGAYTEAGVLLSTLFAWPILMCVLPNNPEPLVRKGRTRRRSAPIEGYP